MIRWGVAGPGGIARAFGRTMGAIDGGTIVAVASRALDRADAYADEFGVDRRYGDYAALAADPDVDAVYVATPHSRHEADAVMYLDGGKHVLCEKPLALDAAQVLRMTEAAGRNERFLMEAMWTRFLPSYRALVDVVSSGRIGVPRFVEGDLGFRAPFDPASRLFDPALGGGALLDVGIYPLQLCTLVLGPVERVVAEGVLAETGVDEITAAVTQHEGGGIGIVKCAIGTTMWATARISGTDGTIEIPPIMHVPQGFTVVGADGAREEVDTPFDPGTAFRFEVEEVHRCLSEGRRESEIMPLSESLALARVMDDVRGQLGVVYPGT